MSFICVNLIIIINCAVYRCIEFNKFETSFNTKINNLLILRSSVPFNEELLNNKKFKSICSNNV